MIDRLIRPSRLPWMVHVHAALASMGTALAPVAVRVALALPFLRSGRTRWDGWFSLSPATSYLFEEQFKLHIFNAQVAIPWPDQVAWLVACAEIVLPALLLAGLATRAAAFGLLVMTSVIQLVFPDGWANFHLYWAALALAAMALGAGPLSLDRLLQSRRLPRGQ
ncbi:DoxX family membrane protein [Luteibacter aegosomaticola]|uniref:DoxX family membrane protein n=1 Tax=Luteibacter aegosomaticola TaxID=2911538 RepID=UPI001FF801EC|nr:DoxX family membrane protein [Luteibacter aegosomaticola]UPG88201.1 DoxX family membrane protein [Luteibacter aegosomaticola]